MNEKAHTPRPWQEGARPTAEQFADWYPTATREERVRIAEGVLADGERAYRCFVQDHDHLLGEVQWAHRRAARYRAAWASARRRIHPQNLLRAWDEAMSTTRGERIVNYLERADDEQRRSSPRR